MRKVLITIVVIVLILFALRAIDEADRARNATGGDGDSVSRPESAENGPEPTAVQPQDESPQSEPVDGVLYNSDATGNYELYRLNSDGTSTQLTSDPAFDSWWVRPSPDRSQILFYRTPAGVRDTDYGQTAMWLAAADGSGAVEVIGQGQFGWGLHGHGEWSPDGSQIVMFAGGRINPQIFVTDARGQNPRQVTTEGGVNLDPSWSPDGNTIVYVGCPNSICVESNQEIYTVPAGGGERTRMTNDDMRDNDPYFSPDGSRIAFLTQTGGRSPLAIAGRWDIRLVASSGGDSSVLTDGEAITSLPRWTPSGDAILTHRLEYGNDSGFDLVAVDPRTGDISIVLQTEANEEYPSP